MQAGQMPGFKRERIQLEPCSISESRAVVKGLLYELLCADCNGSGWVVRGGKLVLSAGELVAQLSFKLQDARVKLQRDEVRHRQADHRVTATDRTA